MISERIKNFLRVVVYRSCIFVLISFFSVFLYKNENMWALIFFISSYLMMTWYELFLINFGKEEVKKYREGKNESV